MEIQAVYFSGKGMGEEFHSIMNYEGASLPFPSHTRRPDYRSSGPKRLLPQLQIKVPTLRRWGKKMAVVVDKHFFRSLGHMEEVGDLSSGDIAWFTVDFVEGLSLHCADVKRGCDGSVCGQRMDCPPLFLSAD